MFCFHSTAYSGEPSESWAKTDLELLLLMHFFHGWRCFNLYLRGHSHGWYTHIYIYMIWYNIIYISLFLHVHVNRHLYTACIYKYGTHACCTSPPALVPTMHRWLPYKSLSFWWLDSHIACSLHRQILNHHHMLEESQPAKNKRDNMYGFDIPISCV